MAPRRAARRADSLPIPAYLIEINDERILVDTGLHPGAARDAGAHYKTEALDGFELEQDASVADQLNLETVTRVILTHLHFDHAGGLPLLPANVPVVLQRREWEAGRDDEAIRRNFYLPRDYAHIAEQLVLVDGDHDLLGDGSIQLLLTPGHTPGHQSIRVGSQLVTSERAVSIRADAPGSLRTQLRRYQRPRAQKSTARPPSTVAVTEFLAARTF